MKFRGFRVYENFAYSKSPANSSEMLRAEQRFSRSKI